MVIGLLLMLRFAYDPDRTHRLRQQQLQLEHLRALNVELVEEIERSRAELEAIRVDPNFLVHVARRDLGMLRPGEFVYEFEEPTAGR
jgi:cell division protein FtsB